MKATRFDWRFVGKVADMARYAPQKPRLVQSSVTSPNSTRRDILIVVDVDVVRLLLILLESAFPDL